MTTLHKAAQQALWAFELHVQMTWPTDRSTAAIAALRAALAQHEEPVQEPVATLIAQRDALLEVVRYIGEYRGEGPCTTPWRNIVAALGEKARAAIKAVEGEKA